MNVNTLDKLLRHQLFGDCFKWDSLELQKSVKRKHDGLKSRTYCKGNCFQQSKLLNFNRDNTSHGCLLSPREHACGVSVIHYYEIFIVITHSK